MSTGVLAAEYSEGQAPSLPDATLPEGLVWPPIAGRALLQELGAYAAEPFRVAHGAWAASLDGRWHLLSSERSKDLDEARADLFAWARLHSSAAAKKVLSQGRCLVLKPDPDGGGRLWQIVPIQLSLRAELDRLSRSEQVKKWTRALSAVAQAIYEVPAKLAEAGLPPAAGLDRLGWTREPGRPVFIGFVPPPQRLRSNEAMPPVEPVADTLASNLDSILFELAFSRRTVLLGVAASLDDMNLEPPLAELRAEIQRALDRATNGRKTRTDVARV